MAQLASPHLDVRVSGDPAGYAFGVSQPSVSMDVTLPPFPRFASSEASEALATLFRLSSGDLPNPKALGRKPQPELKDILSKACGLSKHLLQEAGIPVFALEVLQRLEPSTGPTVAHSLRLRIPVIDFIERSIFATAYIHAFKFLWLFAGSTRDQASIRSYADNLHDSFIVPTRQQTKRGLSTTPIFREVYARGIPTAHLGAGIFQLGTGVRSRLIQKSSTDKDSMIGAGISKQKHHTQALLHRVGAPVADAHLVRSSEAAVQAAQTLDFPVVVKPADCDRSEGVFLDLNTPEAVRTAYEAARKLSRQILVQKRIPGHCHRLVTFQGRFVFGYTRHPPGVDGDGQKSIRALVDTFNAEQARLAQHLRRKPVPFDDRAIACLAAQGLRPDHVLEKGKVAFLGDASTPEYFGYNEIVTEIVHPANVALVERLSKMIRLESVGVDLISTDVRKPWYETGAAITELNFQPQIGDNTARANLAILFPENEPVSVPVECFVGGEAAMAAGQARRAAMAEKGRYAMLTSHEMTLGGTGDTYLMAGRPGLFDRANALLRDPDLEALIVVVQTDEFVRSGPPFMGEVMVTKIDDDVRSHSAPENKVAVRVLNRLCQVLKGQ